MLSWAFGSHWYLGRSFNTWRAHPQLAPDQLLQSPPKIKPNNGGICKIQILVGGSLVVPLSPFSGPQLFLEISAAILAWGLCAFP